mmetsp:Transcript_76838/g.222041  ORF Transcript_76838/g.222041 Transcript_76838/m.222041 type:complete len:299 (+) Transcript_76838:174-1070(+)
MQQACFTCFARARAGGAEFPPGFGEEVGDGPWKQGSLHVAFGQHIDHAEQALLASRQHFFEQELDGVDNALGVCASPTDVVLELELYRAIAARQCVCVPRVTCKCILRHTESELFLLFPDFPDLIYSKFWCNAKLVERADHGFGRPACVRFRRLVGLDDLHAVTSKGARKIGRHLLHRRLEGDDLLAHVGRDDCVGVAVLGDLHQLLTVTSGGAHDERALAARVNVCVRVHRRGMREIDDHQALAVLGLHLRHNLLLQIWLLRANEGHFDCAPGFANLALKRAILPCERHGRKLMPAA